MKKIISAIAFTGLALGSSLVWADDDSWDFLPITKGGFDPDLTVSFLGGLMDPQTHGLDADFVYGLEISANCLLLDPPMGTIRQQLSYSHYDEGGLEITSFEMNPHFLYHLNEKMAIGVGPGLGYVDADGRRVNEGTFSIQGGLSFHYKMSKQMYLGAEVRYQWTKELDDMDDDLKNARMYGKIGYRF
jgi:hypothetical protein